MAKQLSEEQIYEEARARVKAKRSFWSNFGTWAGVNAILIVIWALSGRGYPWFLWPLCIWGIFILIHGLRVYFFENKPEKAAIEKEAERIRKEKGQG